MTDPRAHLLKPGAAPLDGPVLYWMHRDFRTQDNFGLAHAQALALDRKVPLAVAFCLVPRYLDAARRQFAFLLGGMDELRDRLSELRIPLFFLQGDPGREIPELAGRLRCSTVVADFDPVRIKQEWMRQVKNGLAAEFIEVDSRNVVPCRVVSDKREYAARTIRPKLARLLADFLAPPPEPAAHPFALPEPPPPADFTGALQNVAADPDVAPVPAPLPGEDAALEALDDFLRNRLARYHQTSNNPVADDTSRLSAHLHFGNISPLRVGLAVNESKAPKEAREAFLEQLIVRRELADNFCLHVPDYDSPACFPDWAVRTLADHASDPREYLYSDEQFERGLTHDPLWNAAQRQMTDTGFMHNYMRMYWAKKILEWSETVERAMALAVRLNDAYQLDGRDPNGYAGIAWAMGGVHDRAFKERAVIGKLRPMTYKGAKSKFKVAEYVARYAEIRRS